MLKRLYIVIVSIISCSFFMCPTDVFAEHSVFEDVVYATHTDIPDSNRFLKGDVYVPTSKGPHPAIMLMHGGSWQLGDENFYADDWGPYLADHGYVVFSIQYRLSKPGGAILHGLGVCWTAKRHFNSCGAKQQNSKLIRTELPLAVIPLEDNWQIPDFS